MQKPWKKGKQSRADFDQNWWRPVIAPIAVSSALIVAACISGLPSITCAALAKTYNDAIYNFGFSALSASAIFVICMVFPGNPESKGKADYVPGIFVMFVAGAIFVSAASVGIESLDKSIADCYPLKVATPKP